MDKRLHNGQNFQYEVLWREADGSDVEWNSGLVKSPPFIVNNTGTYTPFEIKVRAVNAVGKGPDPEPEIGHSGEDSTSRSFVSVGVGVGGVNTGMSHAHSQTTEAETRIIKINDGI